MPDSQASIQHLKQLLITEKEADLQQYINFVAHSSLTDQVKKGVCWYPLRIEKKGYGLGDYPYIVAERKEVSKDRSFLSGGKPVEVFSDDKVAHGVIHYVNNTKIRINFNSDELPDWLHRGKLGVRLLFDDTSFSEMHRALTLLSEAKGNRTAYLRELLFGNKEASFTKESYTLPKDTPLNASQKQAVEKIITAQDIAVVHGPPGTGKTTTLVHAIEGLKHSTSDTVLVCAPSNTAADVLTERLHLQGLKVVRLGNLSRINEEVINCSLEIQVSSHDYYKDIKKLKQKAENYRDMASKYKRSFGKREREQRKHLRAEANDLLHHAHSLEDHVVAQILDGADAIVCTLVGATNKYIHHKRFKTVVIDEAAQSLEPACWIPILKADKVVLAGDPFQLPPTVKSKEAVQKGLSKTLIEKTIENYPEAVSLLNVQYRMNKVIMGYSNAYFYQKQLKAATEVENWNISDAHQSICFIDTAGSECQEQSPKDSKSLYNAGEFELIQKHLDQLCDATPDINNFSLGIISPYKEQVLYVKEAIDQSDLLSSMNITVQTIDGFQGQERDIIYISLVRSNSEGEIGFLTDYRRMNVAMTRAKKMLVIIGDSSTLGNDPFYNGLLDYVEKENGYQSCWEY